MRTTGMPGEIGEVRRPAGLSESYGKLRNVTYYIQPLRLLNGARQGSGRRNLEATVVNDVAFADPNLRSLLRADEYDQLDRLYPDGVARFFGFHSGTYRLEAGDIVLFQGDRQVYLVGTVGYQFVNRDFADQIWENEGTAGYDAVYSLHALEDLRIGERQIPTAQLWGDQFEAGDYSYRPFTRPSAGVQTALSSRLDWYCDGVAGQVAVETLTNRRIGATETAVPKCLRRGGTRSGTTEAEFTRAESILVEDYQAHATANDSNVSIERSPGRVTDLIERRQDGSIRYIEAKVIGSLTQLRQAFGQLVDYLAHSSIPTPTLVPTILISREPAPSALKAFLAYGVALTWPSEAGDSYEDHLPPTDSAGNFRKLIETARSNL